MLCVCVFCNEHVLFGLGDYLYGNVSRFLFKCSCRTIDDYSSAIFGEGYIHLEHKLPDRRKYGLLE